MKLVLVPGMDGTGELFKEFLTYLNDVDIQVIPLPAEGDQSYQRLTTYIMERLPQNEDFTLLVESFSGPIGIMIAQTRVEHLKKLIVVASFTQALFLTKLPLSRLSVRCARYLPLVSYYLVYGKKPWVLGLKVVIQSLPKTLLAQRIKSIASLALTPEPLMMPVTYLRPSNDHLVSKAQADRWQAFFPEINYVLIDGPHFILQSSPLECADAILRD